LQGGFAARQSTATATDCHRRCALIGGLLAQSPTPTCKRGDIETFYMAKMGARL